MLLSSYLSAPRTAFGVTRSSSPTPSLLRLRRVPSRAEVTAPPAEVAEALRGEIFCGAPHETSSHSTKFLHDARA